jgi:hypothetical protein
LIVHGAAVSLVWAGSNRPLHLERRGT